MSLVELRGKVALVTGASGGIGAAVTAELLRAGATVVGTSRSPHPPRLETLPTSLRPALRIRTVDLADPVAAVGLVEGVEAEEGRLDILVAAAGSGEVLSLEDITIQQWQRSLDVNLTAPFLLARSALPGMTERGWGRILFVSSVAAYTGGFVGPHYASAKAGLLGLTHFLSSRTAGRGVTVNAIAPALIDDTDMIAGMPEGTPVPPVGRLGRPDEVADLALSLLGNAYLTGQTVLLDGGMRPA